MFNDIKNFEMQSSEISFESQKLKCGKVINVYEIQGVHDLIQFIGYGKHINMQNNVFFRGQTQLYDGAMVPSLYRGIKNIIPVQDCFSARVNKLQRNTVGWKRFDRLVLDPLLQHYGYRTSWLDLVDNVWVALWFALHEAKTTTISGTDYVHYYPSQKEYSYIILMGSDANMGSGHNGVYKGKETILVDLRKSTPSYFLRPHAQHAYMIRKTDKYAADYSDLIIGIAKIPTSIGLKWLGNNEFLSLHTLFPPVQFDTGYAYLLKHHPEHAIGDTKTYGSIQMLSD